MRVVLELDAEDILTFATLVMCVVLIVEVAKYHCQALKLKADRVIYETTMAQQQLQQNLAANQHFLQQFMAAPPPPPTPPTGSPGSSAAAGGA